MQRDRFVFVYACLTLLGCGGSPRVSTGPKIFLTSRKHVADFKNDPYLKGDNAIHKADDFCNTDPNRPDAHVYKALLVDGVNRDAKSLTDWVLKPSTTYYRSYDDTVIGTTTIAAIFGAAYAPLTNSVGGSFTAPQTYVWTGIGNAGDFTAGQSCNDWSDATAFGPDAPIGIPTATDGSAFYGLGSACNAQWLLYCVQQP
jgi:hypothetical protein